MSSARPGRATPAQRDSKLPRESADSNTSGGALHSSGLPCSLAESVAWSIAIIALVSSWLMPGDGLPAFETGVIQASLWGALALAVWFPWRQRKRAAVRNQQTRSASRQGADTPRQVAGRSGLLLALDLAVVAWVAWVLLAAVMGIVTEKVWMRPASTLAVQALGSASLYAVARWVATDRTRALFVWTWVVAGAVFLASFAVYQSFVVMPADRAEYFEQSEEAKQALLRSIQISRTDPESRERRLFEERLRSSEPTSTFTLANSLAVVLSTVWYAQLEWLAALALAPWLTRRASNQAANRLANRVANQGEPGTSRAQSASAAQRLALLLIALSWILLSVVLLLTKSRAAVLACGLLSMVAAFRFAWRYRQRWIVIAMLAALVMGVGAGFASGRLDWQVISEAPKSLLYRAQYWQATAPMIADYPLWGVGPGSYQDRYHRYQSVFASETVADPHNAWIEAFAVSGIPAGLALVAITLIALLLSGAGRAIRARFSKQPESSRSETNAADLGQSEASSASQTVASESSTEASISDTDLPQSDLEIPFFPSPTWSVLVVGGSVLAATALGALLAIYQGLVPDFVGFLIAAIPATLVGLSIWACHVEGMLKRAQDSQLFARAIGGGLSCLALALVVTGGYGFWGVSQWGWGLLGLWATLAARSPVPAKTSLGDATRLKNAQRLEVAGKRRVMALWTLGVVAGLVSLGWVVRPTVDTWVQLKRSLGNRAATSLQSGRLEEQLRRWAREQPLSEEPWEQLIAVTYGRWQASEARDGDREAFEEALAQFNRRRPPSANIGATWSRLYLAAWELRHEERDKEAGLVWSERMIEQAPADAYLRATHAANLALVGRNDQAAEQAAIALELDRLNPHADRALRVQSLVGRFGPDPVSAEQRMNEIRSRR